MRGEKGILTVYDAETAEKNILVAKARDCKVKVLRAQRLSGKDQPRWIIELKIDCPKPMSPALRRLVERYVI